MGATKTKSSNGASPDLSVWQARSVHTVTLPSGQRVRIRIPGIGTLLEKGELPTELIDIALMELINEGGATAGLAGELSNASEKAEREKALERIRSYGTFQRHLVAASIVSVETAPEEFADVHLEWNALDEFPEDDVAMVAEIVQRLRAHDARGVRIGVEPLDRWASFREAHGCPDKDCEGCKKLVHILSTADVG